MMAKYIVFDGLRIERIGIFTFAEDAAQCVAGRIGGTIVCNRKVLWCEGKETQSAAESFDHVASVVYEREKA